jgi:hypothetical protein
VVLTDAEQALAGVGGALSGTVGSVVYSHNRHGPYHYDKPSRVDADTLRQRQIREWFGLASAAWRLLSPAQHQAWQNYATNVPRPNRVGSWHCLTGFHHFVAAMTFKWDIYVPWRYDAPEIYTLGRLTPPSYASFISAYILVTFALDDTWRFSNYGAFALFTSPPQSHAVNHYSGPWRYAGSTSGSPTSPPTQALFNPAWPATPRPCYVWVRARAIEPDNRLSPALVDRVYFP